ncbi:RelA/SpoT family protein [Caminibacter pacificus]|uniref:Bifunctional (P)ppGpp synthetase/guanosine-3',5'-bis(Diphosphate) 3'-pyrophosphohydrolase n=1 Tax=Caminibacter pacificus TaxID=1424653 RepID=A0AAJ4UXX4_9BACT|nr:RelA/SpoT family protein [Caminibacter pacificus]NPA87775.1 bifunctional (p)ppGpp synthetase/guanosine-3',5'-bis(diphosphate) 3'-pyrophosphohydrolase [Campylobacterota bacterium]QCI27842.1 bifunctional (p)ppGpp synthetase/guanosine-3',5'-bis(diphosphate) 3'-pyrophosphohydrolase [Caminibacter pacificus]ROR39981.1 GTP pyrophosphokinase/guanosine-3',5'-bis(diphosphate) 3'-pyrophosphohydrolase [Caminibacter pacificus]
MKKDFEQLLQRIQNIKTTEEAKKLLLSRVDTPKIRKALDFAIKAHSGQKRKSGEDYVIHPILVATITSYFNDSEDVIIAAILHDVVEDTEYTIWYIKDEFGSEVANLVEGLTKIVEIRGSSLAPSTSNEKLAKSAMTFRKMLLASINDIRVLVIKLCDRLHNMMTLDALPPHKQKRIAEETLVVYTPIAHRLGIATIKNILEDLAFKYLLPEEYKKIDDYIKKHKEEFQLRLNEFIQKIEKLLLKNGFKENEFEIKSRIKHYYSTYLKMQRKGISIQEVLDLLAVRIIVKKPIECYETLGLVHLNFRPLISRFKDYIAIPKENGYQTIHTTVYDGNSIIEVQIRTEDMDKNAEFGIAAHWKYKLNTALPNLEWLKDMKYEEDVEDFYELAKNDLFSEDIVVYSPKFDTFTLPRGATALDFAYAIHTDVGNKAVEAYVNKEKVSLLHQLKTGDIVRIVTGDKSIPRCSWINALKTSKAKYEQKRLCRQKELEIDRKVAIAILSTIFDLDKFKIRALIKANNLCESVPKIVDDKNFLKEVVKKIYQTIKKRNLLYFKNIKLKEYVFGNIKILSNKPIQDISFHYCCHPKFGDKIVGLLDKKEVEIHHRFCNNAENKIQKAVFVEWVKNDQNRYFLVVSLPNRKGELSKFINFLTRLDIFIHSISLGKESNNCKLEIEFDDKKRDLIKNKISKEYRVIEFIPIKDAYNG